MKAYHLFCTNKIILLINVVSHIILMPWPAKQSNFGRFRLFTRQTFFFFLGF